MAEFKADIKDTLKFAKIAASSPARFRKAMAGYLNTQAFGSRNESKGIIGGAMTIRAARFIYGSLRVQKAQVKSNAGSMIAYMGSLAKERYTGLKEQETGGIWDTSHQATRAGRGGSDAAILPKQYRLGRRHRLLTDVVDRIVGAKGGGIISQQSPASRARAALAILERRGDTRPFLILGLPGRRSGLYKLDGGKLVMLQSIKRRRMRPKKVPWLSGGVKKYLQTNTPVNIFKAELRRQGFNF